MFLADNINKFGPSSSIGGTIGKAGGNFRSGHILEFLKFLE
jgi:hypothetical protein